MPKSAAYEPVLSAQATAFLVGLSRQKQRKLLTLLLQVAEHPMQLGDYSTRDEDGHQLQHLVVGDWHISFWADHAVRELRITELAEL